MVKKPFLPLKLFYSVFLLKVVFSSFSALKTLGLILCLLAVNKALYDNPSECSVYAFSFYLSNSYSLSLSLSVCLCVCLSLCLCVCIHVCANVRSIFFFLPSCWTEIPKLNVCPVTLVRSRRNRFPHTFSAVTNI